MDPRIPDNWQLLGGEGDCLPLRLAALSRAHDKARQKLDIQKTELFHYCTGLSSKEGRIKLAAAWDNALTDFYVANAGASQDLNWKWWTRNTILVAIEPILYGSRTTSVEWCFSEAFRDPRDAENMRPSDMREYLNEPVAGSVYISELINCSDGSDLEYERAQVFLAAEFADKDADEFDPRQYECHVLAEKYLTWKFTVAVDPRSDRSSVDQRQEFNKIDAYWPELSERTLAYLDQLFTEEGRNLFGLAEKVRAQHNADISFEINGAKFAPFVYWFPSRSKTGLQRKLDQPRIIHDKEMRIEWVICGSGRSDAPGLSTGEFSSQEEALTSYFGIKRLFSMEDMKKKQKARLLSRSNVEHLVAESLASQGFLVAIEPAFLFPMQQVSSYRTPDLLVVDGGRMLAIEIDDMSHLVDSNKRPAFEKWQRDRDLDKFMLQHGIPVYRISHKEAMHNPVKVVAEVSTIFANLGGGRLRFQ